MDERIIELLKQVDGISTSDGLEYCGSPAAYEKFINTYYCSIDKKAAGIEDSYNRKDYDDYTIKVHSLKSTSRIAGVSEIAAFALKLEEAGETGDIAFIKENNDRFLDLYRSYKDKLSVLEKLKDPDDEVLKPISGEDLQDAYRSLYECIGMMDYDAVEMILEEVKKYRLPQCDKNVMDELDKLLRNMDWDELEKLAAEKIN